ncbi:CusA/CzcA family heavy metal efflux RND transporter [Rhodovarius crocodyli]|uniref:CusA/CzcA family heavy metal efflux RND transporter n=1 Tax=Rhodovarius crocodyli TaxID=1979269 RepID=A0A437M3E8_9PROT|nr:CusA/CzcA family heavy metal efflux RND transporter [Rhodovarius crocodyli]RVT92229.1 CusA/CzcA family heavy metal efflux RND transporter [Rhodovarius crocodyli]
MLLRLVELALRQRLLVVLAAIAIAVWGANSYRNLSIDAFPDVSPPQVLVSMRAPGLTPEELEARVTTPIELAMRGIPGLESIRSVTRYAVTLMTFQFQPGTDVFWARAQVNERLNQVENSLPDGVDGGLAPVVTALGEMLMFTLEGDNLTVTEARTLMDWTIRPILRGVPGVADVNTMGGYVRTYEVVPSGAAMAARGITTKQLEEALERNNRNDGAGRLSDGEEALLVRAEGRIRSLDDVRGIVVVARNGQVVRVGDIADVRFGSLARNGVVARNGQGEAVWGTVLGLQGANAASVVTGVRARLPEIQARLPEGVHIHFFYDRSELIGKAVWTVQKVLLEAIVLVVVLLVLFLGNMRAAMVVSLMLPLAVLGTFGIMKWYGLTANIMSLGGLAIAIGLLVDCGVVVVENVAHKLNHHHGKTDLRARLAVVNEAVREVMVPLVSGVMIIVTVFVPLLSLQGVEGRLFGPVALTIAFALIAALLLAITVVPVMSVYMLKKGSTEEPWLVRKLHKGYDPALEWALKRPLAIAGVVAVGVVCAYLAFGRLGSTFMPTMDEGNPVITIRSHPTIGVDDSGETMRRIQQELMTRVPEIVGIMGRAGADELGIDPVGLNDSDMFLQLKPQDQWRPEGQRGGTAWLMEQLRLVLDNVPGITFSFAQPIDMRVQEMIIGARGDVVVKVFGPDLDELNRIGREVAEAIRSVPGSSDVFALRNDGMKYLTIDLDRLALGRLGLNAADVQDALRVWVDGRQVGIVLEGEMRIPVQIRGEAADRRTVAALAAVPIALPGGGTVPLTQIAQVREEEGPIEVRREEVQRLSTVLSNVSGRDLVGFVDDAKAAVAQRVQMPQGYSLVWGGQFENQQRASARLAVVVPIALGVIFLLLYLTFNSGRQAALVFCNVPFALIGGIIALYLSGQFISVPASVGFLTLIGIAVLNGVVLVSTINRLIAEEGLTLSEAVREGAKRRMTPVMLTASIAAFALVPFLFATGPGSEIQKPLAIVVIGGLVTATALTLLLLPILYERFALPRSRVAAGEANPEEHVTHGPVPAKATTTTVAVLAALLLGAGPAQAQGQAAGRTPIVQGNLAGHVAAALDLDADLRGLLAQREAAVARGIVPRGTFAGPASVSGIAMSGTRRGGNNGQPSREIEVDLAAPIWLPGQRAALSESVNADVLALEGRVLARRLAVAGSLRNALWDAVLARREAGVARDRLATSRDITRDLRRRSELGDVPPTEALLAQNETLAAELAYAQADARADQLEAEYATLTGGLRPVLPTEDALPRNRLQGHPQLAAARAALEAAQARARLVAATPRENPEIGVFTRYEGGFGANDNTSIGLRFRLPFASEQRNLPRRAEAQSEVTRASAELAQSQRLLEAGVRYAEAALRASETNLRIARQRLSVANEQEGIARRAFRSGETGAFELFRVRQLQQEAQMEEARAAVNLNRARALVNQSLGAVP